jgi:hypothetical protein
VQLYDQLNQLIDVPATFRRPTLIYQQIFSALAAGLTLLTESSNAVIDQTTYQNTIAGWIDVWADLAGILRRTDEGDGVFQARVPDMLLAARDSIVAIQTWLAQIENLPTSLVIETPSPSIGYSVTLPGTLTPQKIIDVSKNLAWVRPAGVPFNFSSRSGGTYLNTVNYLGGGRTGTNGFPSTTWQGARVTGAFLAFKFQVTGATPPASTNNNVSQLPDLLLQDPTLNPNLNTPLTVV